jgi:hypothetical protein
MSTEGFYAGNPPSGFYAGDSFVHQQYEKRVRPWEELSAEVKEATKPPFKVFRSSAREDEALARLDAEIEKLRIRNSR